MDYRNTNEKQRAELPGASAEARVSAECESAGPGLAGAMARPDMGTDSITEAGARITLLSYPPRLLHIPQPSAFLLYLFSSRLART